ncbi:MAG: aldolase/citrate lyase family protein, partial [Blastocatellia bacterium]
EYTAQSNAETMVIAQVETAQAVEALPEIVQVPDIDVIFIGPSDLSHSIGLPGEVNHPEVQALFDRIVEIVKPTGIAIGTLVPNLESALKWQERGARYLMITMEAILGPACRSFLQAARAK